MIATSPGLSTKQVERLSERGQLDSLIPPPAHTNYSMCVLLRRVKSEPNKADSDSRNRDPVGWLALASFSRILAGH